MIEFLRIYKYIKYIFKILDEYSYISFIYEFGCLLDEVLWLSLLKCDWKVFKRWYNNRVLLIIYFIDF